MHSSRMRTGRSLTVCCSVLPDGGLGGWGGSPWSRGGSPWSRGEFSLVGGVVWSGGVSAWCQGGVCLVPGGVCLVLGGFSGDPPANRITDTCKNITLATTSLRPVIILLLHSINHIIVIFNKSFHNKFIVGKNKTFCSQI